jgi:Glycosyltransferase family 17
MIYDTFMFNDELDILECRLRELENVPDLVHVLVESEIGHRGYAKSLHYDDSRERFSPWSDRIRHVIVEAFEMPDAEQYPDPWIRERAQREFVKRGLPSGWNRDILLHGDVDEIPDPVTLQEVVRRGNYPVALSQRLCQYAVDWVHPLPWHGTIVTPVRSAGSLATLRDRRNSLPVVTSGGNHLSWMGGTDAHILKLAQHCHLEMTSETEDAIISGKWLRDGMHSDGHKLIPVDVDESWPRWVQERKCPASWFRPREGNEG